MSTATVTQAPANDASAHPYYRISSLASGFIKMWRGWWIGLLVVAVNALIQALLILPTLGTITSTAYSIFSVIASAVVLLVSALLMQAVAIEACYGKVRWAAVVERSRRNGLRYCGWIVVVSILVVIGLMIYTWPGLFIAALTPFVGPAAVLGDGNPFGKNFRVLGKRFGRWLITLLIIGIIAFVIWFLMVLNWFFVPSAVGAFASCFVGGLLAWWWATTMSLIYLSVTDPNAAKASP